MRLPEAITSEPRLQRVLGMLADGGHAALIVGGCLLALRPGRGAEPQEAML